ncbi:bifunctional diaminohydroxyphosphoribosylaminopyrimidine deaminase/5-amino-6-(5-phosphoribosylamino)uracil reductase RibD [Flavobacteriaceae bacterium R38]|nr:bifunctional diaminohydroxyphosphoribosylaminopyrimidine deaminase/5-amino-6-(5-phosphoribosylamino)uracil reductase RibD [Flavobacteriaceae bacterium R38]
MKIHEKYISRCIELAKNGLQSAMPNPSVGAVIVSEGKIIGEGYTSPYGGAHAEVNAINSVSPEKDLENATIYVSLEPCSHYGKTPPCSDLIIAKGIKNVVIGCVDPFSEVAGKGIERLKKAGCNVVLGVLEKECIVSNKRFFTFHTQKRPYIILKWAQTTDHYIAPDNTIINSAEAASFLITNQYSRQLVHKWRAEEQSILVGTNTVINDNPKLNTRDWEGKSPLRIIIDQNLRITKNYSIYDKTIPTLMITGNHHDEINTVDNIIYEQIDFSTNIAIQICNTLYKHNIQSVIIEGGTQTLQTFINENLWDEARVFTANKSLKKGVKAPKIDGTLIEESNKTGDHLKILKNI